MFLSLYWPCDKQANLVQGVLRIHPKIAEKMMDGKWMDGCVSDAEIHKES